MDGMSFVRIGTGGIRDVRRGSLNYHHLQRTYVLPTGSHVIVGEFSAELEIAQDIISSACRILNALPRLHYHNLIIVDNLRLEAGGVCVLCVCGVCICVHVYACMCECVHVCVCAQLYMYIY